MNDILARECNKDKTEMNGARASLLSRRAQESGECLPLEDLFICEFVLFFLPTLKFDSLFSFWFSTNWTYLSKRPVKINENRPLPTAPFEWIIIYENGRRAAEDWNTGTCRPNGQEKLCCFITCTAWHTRPELLVLSFSLPLSFSLFLPVFVTLSLSPPPSSHLSLWCCYPLTYFFFLYSS